jgi:uncharacterized protein YjiK
MCIALIRVWRKFMCNAVTIAVLWALGCLVACGKNWAGNREYEDGALKLITEYAVDISEPSGLTIDPAGKRLWAVGGNERVYELDLQGRVLKVLDYRGRDPEGISYDPSDSTLWLVEERRREIVHLDLDGTLLMSGSLDLEGAANNGLEGICRDDEGVLYVLNEKSPGLFIQLKDDLSIQSSEAIEFADDYSGLFCAGQLGVFWILSDQDETLFRWDEVSGILNRYELPFSSAEGIAIDEAAGRVYIVSDWASKLFVFEFPSL